MEINDDSARRLEREIANLAKEAVSLKNDVRKIARQFFPKLDRDAPEVRAGASITVPVKTAEDLTRLLRLHRRSLQDSQGYVLQMEAHLRTIRDKLVTSRTEFEPFMKAISRGDRADDD